MKMKQVAENMLEEPIKRHEKWYTVKDIAKILKIHEETVRRSIRQGRLEGSKFGRDHRISHDSLMDYIQSKKYRVHSQPIPNEPEIKKGTAKAILKVFGKWAGDDSEEIIDLIYSTRSKAEF
jgi:excisionase family DNA binding protein